MREYLLYGKILPERAIISFKIAFRCTIDETSELVTIDISVINNQLAVRIECEENWNISSLRNIATNAVRGELARHGYLMGYAYDLEITRILNKADNIDWVYGVDLHPQATLYTSDNLEEKLSKLRNKSIGRNGAFLNRCLNDLISAMRYSDDTGFYCYRAIEALRLHCAAENGLDIGKDNKREQWEKFLTVLGSEKGPEIDKIRTSAEASRHGDIVGSLGSDRQELLITTWQIVGIYLDVQAFNNQSK